MKFPKDIFLAHTAETTEGALRAHELAEHLRHVAAGAAANAAHFGGEDWARLAGLWHDLGKYRPGFQRYIRECVDGHIEGRTPSKDKTHSAAGALHAIKTLGAAHGPRGTLAATVLAYLIAGHHAGLADWHGGLKGRLASDDAQREYAEAWPAADPAILETTLLLNIKDAVPGGILTPGAFALWIRLLFSALVDADFLDTEAFMDEGKTKARGNFPPLSEMRGAYNAHMACFAADTKVRQIRADILRQCRDKAAAAPGLYTLTVPTGGGKTLASLGFALDHAVTHGKRRIIYAIPYTSIIEQTADVFREVFASLGQDCVVEHHSQAESHPSAETSASRLACENWDAPLVVTTNVQLFESLFAARTSRCRKLHQLVGSVLILDEAQQLPPEFLQPILDVLRLLIRHYDVTVVLCTATQPALTTTDYFDPAMNLRGLDDATELMDDPDALYTALKRVDVHLPADFTTPVEWPALANELNRHDSVLAIVNTRGGARELHRLMPKGSLHLSTLMCGAHRKDVIDHIKARLDARRKGHNTAPLRVVSTQLVEAGVDLDFPVVYRALAGLDSIAQAAGRCNREGILPEPGKVFVFVPPGKTPAGSLSQGAQACRSVLHGTVENPLDHTLIEAYFRQFYACADLDKHDIVKSLQPAPTPDDPLSVDFRKAADQFRLIPDNQAPVVVLYRGPDGKSQKVEALLGKIGKEGPNRGLMRALQRYIVTLRKEVVDELIAHGDLVLVPQIPGLYAQANDTMYDDICGLSVQGEIEPWKLVS